MSIADRVFETTKVVDEGLLGLMQLDAARTKSALEAQQQEFNNKLALAQLESDQLSRKTEVLTTAYATQADAYKGLQQALVENSDLAGDEAWMRNYETVFQNHLQARNMLFAENGITLPKLTDSFDIVSHELSILPPDKSVWVDGTTDKLIKDKYGVSDEALKEIKIAWKGLQPYASKEEQSRLDKQLKLWTDNVLIDGKPVDSFSIPGEEVLTAEEQALESSVLGELLVGGGTLGSLKAIGKFIPKSFWSKLSQKLEPVKPYKFKYDAIGRPAFPPGRPTYEQGPSARIDLRKFGLEGAKAPTPKGGITPFGKRVLGYGLTGAGLLAADDIFAAGMDSSVLPQSAVKDLQNLDSGFGTGTGGMLSFADDIKLSPKAAEFLKNLAMYENEYGESQGRKYVSKEFAKLSEKEQEEVIEFLENKQ
jgi:hypothetical protein